MPQILLPQMKRLVVLFYIAELYPLFFHASPEGRTGVSSYTGEGRHLGGIIGIPWPGSEAGLGVHVAIIRSFLVVCALFFPALFHALESKILCKLEKMWGESDQQTLDTARRTARANDTGADTAANLMFGGSQSGPGVGKKASFPEVS